MADARILAYHSLLPWQGDQLGISPEAFERQMDWLAAHRWQCLSLDAWLDHLETGTRPERPSFVLTFDDGYAGLLEHAAPVLQRHGWTATMFVVTDALENGRFPARAADGVPSPLVRPQRRSLTWNDAERWVRLGLSIGNHTRTHPALTRIRSDVLYEEIAGASAFLRQRLGVERPAFCYPFGALDETVAGVVRATGHRCGVVTPTVAGIPSGLWMLHRVGIYHEDIARFRFKLSGCFPTIRSVHLMAAVRRARIGPRSPGPAIRVLQVTSGSEIGGIERMMPRLVSSLRRQGVEATVLPARPGGPAEELLMRDGTPVLRLPGAGGILGKIRRLRRVLRADVFDVVHAYGGHATLLSRLAIAGMPGPRPRIVTGILSTGHAAGCAKWIMERATARWNDLYISNSRAGIRAVQGGLAVGSGRIHMIHDGIEPEPVPAPAPRARTRELISVPEEARLLICVANLRPMKGHRVLLEAFGGIANEPVPVHLLLVGRDCIGGEIQRLAARNPAATRIHFLGMRNDIEDLLAASDLFVLASDWEGLPVSILEAMRAALPVVATAVSGIPEAIRHGEHGLLVPPGRPDLLRSAIVEILGDPARAREMGRAARASLLSRFTIDRMSRRLAEIYRAPGRTARGVRAEYSEGAAADRRSSAKKRSA